MKDTALRRVLQREKRTAQDLADATGYSYAAVKQYVRGDRPMPGEFIRKAASFLGEIEEGWLAGSREKLYAVLEAKNAKQRAAIDAVDLPGMTAVEEQQFRAALARWIKADPCPFPERLDRMRQLAGYLEPPFGPLGPRELSDYRVGILHSLMLAMPKRGK